MSVSERVRKLLLYKKYIDFCLEKELTGEYPRWGNQDIGSNIVERTSELGRDDGSSKPEAGGEEASGSQ